METGTYITERNNHMISWTLDILIIIFLILK